MSTDDLAAIAHLDFSEIRCQCQQYGCQGKCPKNAELRVKFHALDQCDGKKDTEQELDEDGNHTFLLCVPCLKSLMVHVARHIASLNAYGTYTCQTCGAPAVSTKPDIIREATPL